MKINLLCEYMLDPTGVDSASPLLLWNAEATFPDARITLRQAGMDGLLWDSGYVPNEGRLLYGGAPLLSGRTYLWQVTLRADGQVFTSDEARFTMGLLPEDAWQARWVGGIRITPSATSTTMSTR